MASYHELFDAIARVRAATGDRNSWRDGLSGADIAAVCNPLCPPAVLGDVLAKVIAAHPGAFAAGPPSPPPQRVNEGAAADAIRDAETALAQQHSAAAQLDLQVVTAVLNAHTAHDNGLAELERLKREIEGAVLSRTDLDTASGARDFQRFLIGKVRDIRTVVDETGLDATSRAALAAALASLYSSTTPESAPRPGEPPGEAPGESVGDGDGPEPGHGRTPIPANDTESDSAATEFPDSGFAYSGPGLFGRELFGEAPPPGFTGPVPESAFVPPAAAPPAACASPAPAPPSPAAAPVTTPMPAWGGAAPGSFGSGPPMPFGGGPAPLSSATLRDLLSHGAFDVPAEEDRGHRDDPATAGAQDPGRQAPTATGDEPIGPTGDTTTVELPGGRVVTAPSPELAAVITAAVSGTPIPDAFRAQDIALPPPGSAVPSPVAVTDLMPGDVGILADRHALALGAGQALLDRRIQPIAGVSGPGFLGWLHPPAPGTAERTPEVPAPPPPQTAPS